MNAADHRIAFRTKLAGYVKADEVHLAHFRSLLATTQERLSTAPDDPILSYQMEALTEIIAMSETKLAYIRKTLERTVAKGDKDQP